MQRVQDHLYNYPVYYDAVFGSDWQAEFHFLFDCMAQHGDCPLRRIFEPACGTGRLLWRLAAEGFEVSGNDLNAKAVSYCNARLRKHGLPETAFVGDMADFTLEEPVDLVFNTINSFRHLGSETAAEAHLRCVAHALNPGGLYLLGLHLTPTRGQPMESESWSARRGSLLVESNLWTIETNLKRREERIGMTFDITTPNKQFRIEDETIFRTYTAKQMDKLLASEPRLETVATYDFCYDLAQPITIDPTTEDVVFVLRRRAD